MGISSEIWVVCAAVLSFSGWGCSTCAGFLLLDILLISVLDTLVHCNKVSDIYWPVRHLLTDIHLSPLKSSSHVDNLLNCQDGVSVSTLVGETGCDFISASRMHTKGMISRKSGLNNWKSRLWVNAHDPATGDDTITSVFADICLLEELAAVRSLNLHLLKTRHPY